MNGNQNEEEIFIECMRKLELGKLANEGNIFAIHQQTTDRSGLRVNFEALLPKECSHTIETVPYFHIRADFDISLSIGDGWEIEEKSCSLCGKTLELRIRKPKRPRRLE